MNIKIKATLITVAGFLGIIAFFYTIWNFPIAIVFAVLAGLVYSVYKGVLSYLEHSEKSKPR